MKLSERKLKLPTRNAKKLKWGVAGCGKFMEQTFLPTLMQLKKSKLVSVYSSSKTRADFIADKFSAANSFSDFDLFLQSGFDALYIGSNNADHYEQVIKAARAKKNILCEKPLALNSAQAEEMVRVCNENNVSLSVNYVHRFHPLVVKAKELITREMIGKIVNININFNIDLPPSDNFRFKKNLSGGGALRDLGTHMIDLMRYFGGEIEDIKGFVDNVIYKSEVDDYSTAVIKFQDSGYGSFSVSFNAKKSFNRIEIVGFKGAISIDSLIGSRQSSAKLTIDLVGEGKKAFRRRANKMIHLLKSVQDSFLSNSTPSVTGEDGLVNLKLMEKLELQ